MPEERDVVIFTPLEMIGRVGHLLSHTEVQAHETARVINRGTGGREVASRIPNEDPGSAGLATPCRDPVRSKGMTQVQADHLPAYSTLQR